MVNYKTYCIECYAVIYRKPLPRDKHVQDESHAKYYKCAWCSKDVGTFVRVIIPSTNPRWLERKRNRIKR